MFTIEMSVICLALLLQICWLGFVFSLQFNCSTERLFSGSRMLQKHHIVHLRQQKSGEHVETFIIYKTDHTKKRRGPLNLISESVLSCCWLIRLRRPVVLMGRNKTEWLLLLICAVCTSVIGPWRVQIIVHPFATVHWGRDEWGGGAENPWLSLLRRGN